MTTAIAQSALLLNKDGSIYHLKLLPEDLATTIILVGDPDRVAKVSRHFDHIEVQKRNREFVTHTGTLGKQRLSVVSTGIGVDNIDIVINELDALVNVDLKKLRPKQQVQTLNIIRLGTCGALSKDIHVGECIVSDYAIAFDGLLHYYQATLNDREQQLLRATQQHFCHLPVVQSSYVAAGSEKLQACFTQSFHHGITLTCNGFYGLQRRFVRAPLSQDTDILSLASQFQFGNRRVVNFEMETAGIYALSRLLGHHACSISVAVVNRITDDLHNNPEKATATMIERALETIVGDKMISL